MPQRSLWPRFFSLFVFVSQAGGISAALSADPTVAKNRPPPERLPQKSAATAQKRRAAVCAEKKTAAGFCPECKANTKPFGFEALKKTGQTLLSAGLNEDARHIIDSMSKISECPERIWPGLALTRTPYIVLDKKTRFAAIISHDECGRPSYRTPSGGEVTEAHFQSAAGFEPAVIDSKKGVSISLPEESDPRPPEQKREQAFSLLVHEAFHICDQTGKDWKEHHSLKDRFRQNAEGCEPRKHRAHVRHYLEEAMKSDPHSENRRTALQKAAWWNEQYKNKFPEEFKVAKTIDTSEGSAEFVTIRALAVRDKGCRASEEELRKSWAENYFKTRGKEPKILMSVDAESYSIGALSVALLEASGPPHWRKKIKGGRSPTELLLKDASPPIKTPEMPEIQAACRFFEMIGQYRDFSVKAISQMLESEDYAALSFPATKETMGPYSMRGIANKGIQEYELARLNAGSQIDTGPSKITFTNSHLLTPEKGANDCGKNQKVVLIPKSTLFTTKGEVSLIDFSGEKDDLDMTKGKIRKIRHSLKGRIKVKDQFERKGADLICAE